MAAVLKLIRFQLRKNLRGRMVLMLEMTALILVVCATLSQLIPFLSARMFHRSLGLRRIFQFETSAAYSAEEKVLPDGVIDLGPSYYPLRASQDPGLTLRCFSEAYFTCIKYDFARGTAPLPGETSGSDGNAAARAVVTQDLAETYRVGQSYTVKPEGARDSVTFTVTGVLKGNRAYLPGTDGYNMELSKKVKKTVFLAENEALSGLFRTSSWHTGWVTDAAGYGDALEALQQEETVLSVWNGNEVEEQTVRIRLEILGPIFILLFASVGLCLAAYLSHVMLFTLSCERRDSIYWICGANGRFLDLLYCLSEAVPVAGASLLALLFTVVLDDGSYLRLRPETFGVGVLIALGVYLISVGCGIVLRKRRGSMAETAGRNP